LIVGVRVRDMAFKVGIKHQNNLYITMYIVLQKSTPWVTSAFDDFIDISSSNLNKQKPAKKENSKVSWSRKSSG
jgi:hypothetical protein